MTTQISEWRNVDKETFENEIYTLYQPAVLRGFADDWPAVAAGRESPQSIAQYLLAMDSKAPIGVFVGEPDIKGRFFYTESMKQLNFKRTKDTFREAIERLLLYVDDPSPYSLYIGSTPTEVCVPDFTKFNQNSLISEKIVPNIWIGNKSRIAAHYDISDNIACVVAGQRRFTLFPPDQVENLYIGPIDVTIAGQPASIVDLANPDFEKFPRFKQALAMAQVAVLEPGDAIYIPSMWWHNVEALSTFNVLINYWWDDSVAANEGSPFECLVHALLTIRSLPPERRTAWKAMFDYYIFNANAETHTHLPEESRGALGEVTPKLAKYLQIFLKKSINDR
jgi:hypothetical protein